MHKKIKKNPLNGFKMIIIMIMVMIERLGESSCCCCKQFACEDEE